MTAKLILLYFVVLDGAGVAGQGLNVASEFVPNEYGQGTVKTTLKYS